ncbi:acyltransferase family protein [Streptosporangium sp. NPDC049046]|uniref:acyltransferase family protein n=1 Tax=Streptosporangium sp. NPDC049046 TaxID=3155031 RepID=UPI0034121911
MSDIRPFQVPAPQDDGGSDPGSDGANGGQGRRSAPWPTPGQAQASGGSQPSWPEPPGPVTSGGASRRDAGDGREESPGEVTEWGGYPAYREPHPGGTRAGGPSAGESHPGGPHFGETHPGEPRPGGSPFGEPRPGGSPFGESYFGERPGGPSFGGAHGSHDPLDLSKPLAPEPVVQDPSWDREEPGWAQDGPSWTRESPWAQETPSWAEGPTPPQGAPRAPSPRPDWAPPPMTPRVPAPASPPPGAAHPQDPGWTPAPGRPRFPEEPELSGLPGRPRLPGEPQAPVRFPDAETPRPRQEPRPSGERPFSYWENTARDGGPSYWENTTRDGGPSFWNQGPRAEQELRAERERETVAEEEPPAPPVKKKREPYLDNVKFVLIALVVMGHSLVPTLKAHSSEAAYLFIYTFHMPAFVLISGYLGRNFWNSNAKINKLVDTLLIPYIVVEIGYALLRYGLGQKWTLTIIDPAWLNWYLVALVLWRISTPIWTRMRQPLLVAVVIYLVAGFSEISGDFSIDRFFGLLPFYVLGLLLKPEHFDLLKPLWVKITSAVVLIGAAGVAILIAPHVPRAPIYFRYSFKAMDMSWWVGLGVRGALLIAALAMTVALLALIPRGETWFSDLGTRTLYAYLLHGVVVVIAKDQGWLSFPWLYGPLGVAAIASSSLALAIVLCLPETRKLFKWMLEPRLVWLYRRPSPPPAATTAPAEGAPAAKESSASVPR